MNCSTIEFVIIRKSANHRLDKNSYSLPGIEITEYLVKHVGRVPQSCARKRAVHNGAREHCGESSATYFPGHETPT